MTLQLNTSFIKAAQDWEIDAFGKIFNMLYSSRIRREGEEKILWTLFKMGYSAFILYIGSLLIKIVIHFVEEYLASKASLESCFLYLDDISSENSHHGECKEKAHSCDRLVLYV